MAAGKTVFVVDDEFDLLQAICATLELEGYHVESAPDGRVCLEKLNARRTANAARPDLLITDVMMPFVSGYELVERVRAMSGHEDLKTVIMSAMGRREGVGTADAAWLEKPFSLEDLIQTVTRLIGPPP